MTTIIPARNVNDAFQTFKTMFNEKPEYWINVSPRGKRTMEYVGPVITEYSHPTERVLFDKLRDANPFFHFFESLWILAGRKDVKFLDLFNKRMKTFSDDGKVFHGAYGYRLRNHFTVNGALKAEGVIDQLYEVVRLLRKDHDTRRAVLSIWDPVSDLYVESKDIPCNDMIFFKVRANRLHMTVCCRSNDVVWGAYGTNVVQFSMIQEFVACAIGAGVGNYRQFSDSFHIYPDEESFKKSVINDHEERELYEIGLVNPYPLFDRTNDYSLWLSQLESFIEHGGDLSHWNNEPILPFFTDVAGPLYEAWAHYTGLRDHGIITKRERVAAAMAMVVKCQASDWKLACHEWLKRRDTDE